MNVLGLTYSDSEEEDSPVRQPADEGPLPPKVEPTLPSSEPPNGKEAEPLPGDDKAKPAVVLSTLHEKFDTDGAGEMHNGGDQPATEDHQPAEERDNVPSSSNTQLNDAHERHHGESAAITATMRDLLQQLPYSINGATEIPPEPEGDCDPALQDKITKWLELKSMGTLFNERLTGTHAFRNPAIMSKLIEYLDLDEIGSNYPREMFDPHGFPENMYYEQIVKAQGAARDAPAPAPGGIPSNVAASLQQAQQRAIQFVSNINKMHAQATANPSAASSSGP
ncbi:hypothetical protein HDV00_000302 [Rhizophlyctis rosea]|nr:hypothetical protein HDV00_000302 [Rhizophlyctis rosea]